MNQPRPDRQTDDAFCAQIARYLDGETTADDLARLDRELADSPQRRELFVAVCLQAAVLAESSGDVPQEPAVPAGSPAVAPLPPLSRQPQSPILGFLGDIGRQGWGFVADHLGMFALLVGFAVVGSLATWAAMTLGNGQVAAGGKPAAPVARLTRVVDCRWTSAQTVLAPGAGLVAGQRLEIASGSAEIVFNCGAVVRIEGPAIFEVASAREMRLMIGKASARADTPAAKGFAIRTRTLEAVDLGTEFVALAAPDGHCEVSVSQGRVEVNVPGDGNKQVICAGGAVLVEPGTPCIVTRIERGDGTAAFKFPTVEPPSSSDYADASQHHATIRVVEGKLAPKSAPVGVLLDGRGQSRWDAVQETAFFADNTPSGKILLDLGRTVAIRKVRTYSWHRDDNQPRVNAYYTSRAPQRYTLYGFAGGTPSGSPPPFTGDLQANGWTRVSRVDTDEFFTVPPVKNRPPQQAVSITSATGEVGRYRYLLWDVRPTQVPAQQFHNVTAGHTFYGEFDVEAEDRAIASDVQNPRPKSQDPKPTTDH